MDLTSVRNFFINQSSHTIMITTSKHYVQDIDVQEARQITVILNEIDDLIDLAKMEGSSDSIKKFIGTSKIKDTPDNREILEQLGIVSVNTHKKQAVELMKVAYKIITESIEDFSDKNKYVDTEAYRDIVDLYKNSERYLYKQMAHMFNPVLFNDITIQ